MAGLPPDLLRNLAFTRLADARSLLVAGQDASAWYVAGYVLELALKATICRTLRLSVYPEVELGGKFKTHKVPELILLAGLQNELATRRQSSEFADRWKTVTDWQVEDRYSLVRAKQDVIDLLDAYEHLTHGVLTWLTSRW